MDFYNKKAQIKRQLQINKHKTPQKGIICWHHQKVMYRSWKHEGLASKLYKLASESINDLNVIRSLIFFHELLKYIINKMWQKKITFTCSMCMHNEPLNSKRTKKTLDLQQYCNSVFKECQPLKWYPNFPYYNNTQFLCFQRRKETGFVQGHE